MKKPDIHPSVFVAPGAVVRGDVQLAAGSSVFYNAVLRGDSSGIAMTMDTTSPGVQLYTANWLSRRGGKNGAVYEPRCAVCLEPQFPPDAVHHPGFPQPLLRRGEVYRHCTVYSFSK